jgi:ribonucleoside-diphosphate reductase alpha chain
MSGSSTATSTSKRLQVTRVFTASCVTADGVVDPLDRIEWKQFDAAIKGESGTVFEMKGVTAPASWSQLAVDIAASKYFRKAGVPGGTGNETSVRQLIVRVARAIRLAGERQEYFASPADAQAFEDELKYLLATQRLAFNSPVWFNCGLAEAYDIRGEAAGNWCWQDGAIRPAPDAYTFPQVSACFILSIQDDLMDIARHVEREMRIFKYGSGAGANFSNLRAAGEKLSNGGTSSGMMDFLTIYDRSAGAIKSGGTTRRAAKMVVVDVDHPDIDHFIEWKAKEEDKARALIAAGYSADFNGEAYRTISGQNANNSVRVTDEFMKAALTGGEYETRWRTSGGVATKKKAKETLRKIADATWRCADPGMQYDTTINKWHTCADTTKIRASNPCSEYMFIDNSACNLASLNLVHFDTPQGFDSAAFMHACRVTFIAQEVLVDHASYPTQAIAQNSHDYRPLGLGFANLGALLMRRGVAYDSDQGRGIAAGITSLMTAVAYEASADMAAFKGPFPKFRDNRESTLRVLEQHREAHRTWSKLLPTMSGTVEPGAVAWDSALVKARQYGVRNAQATLLAPTGTIGLLMDCDTTGVEPDFALTKEKKLAGGGKFTIVNQSVEPALARFGYAPPQRAAILEYLKQHHKVEGAPGLKEEHLPVFDCANKCGDGARFIEPMGHIRMMEVVQPFLSGAISKTVNVPENTTVEQIEALYVDGWKRGLKAVAIYRENSKGCQVLTSSSNAKKQEKQQKRRALPNKRRGYTQKASIGGQKVYVRTGEYEDGTLGEVFIDMHKEGATMRSMTNCFRGDTRFFDGHRLVKLEDAVGEKVCVTCVDGQRREAVVKNFGVQRFHDVVLKPARGRNTQFRRVVTATKDHRWILDDGSVTQDIRVGHKLAALSREGQLYEGEEFDRGFLHGFTFGDGSRHTYHPHRYRIRLCGAKDGKHLARLKPLVRSITYPHANGDPMLYFESDIDLKAVPDESKVSESYVYGFIRGWLAADGCVVEREGREERNVLATQNREAADWLIARAPFYGLMVVGFSQNSNVTNFGKRAAPLNQIALAEEMQSYVVAAVIDNGEEDEAYCVVEPETSSFVLEGGIVTGNCLAISVSLGLQHGVPLAEYVDAFTFTNFAPNGVVNGHPNIKHASSVIDFIFRLLGFDYLGRADLVQVKPGEGKEAAAPTTPMIAADGKVCGNCGNLATRKNGTCYVCENCGTQTGCA